MAIKKQEFYEGAALHLLARAAKVSIRYKAPFFLLNDRLLVYLKYSTRTRSPWAFTFTADEQRLLRNHGLGSKIIIGLICGADGVASFTHEAYRSVASERDSAVHIACYRRHGEHYALIGPDGELNRKIAPSEWLRILDQ